MQTEISPPTIEYYLRILSAFSFYFEKTKRDFGVEDLHRLRVEVKKLRALYRFLDASEVIDFNKSDHYTLLTKIFKPGGRLRETQMNEAIIKRYRSYHLSDYETYLNKLKAKQSKKFKKSLKKFDSLTSETLNEHLIEQLSKTEIDALEKDAFLFVNLELEAIRKLRPLIHSDTELHQVRTHTKAMGYIVKLLMELKPSEELAAMQLSAKKSEKLIGNWHDRVVLANSLRRFLNKNPHSEDFKHSTKLIMQIDRRNKQVVETISERLDGFIYTKL